MASIIVGPCRRRFCRSLLTVGTATTGVATLANARAGDATPIVLTSLVGDGWTLVTHRMLPGAARVQPHLQRWPLASQAFDDDALARIGDVFHDTRPGVPFTIARLRDPALCALQDRVLAGAASTEALGAQIAARMHASAASRIVAFVKHRAPAAIRIHGGTAGTGALAGIGLYHDPGMLVTLEPGHLARGLLAAYAYVKALTIDPASGAIAGEVSATEAELWLDENAARADALGAIAPARTLSLMQTALRNAVRSVAQRVAQHARSAPGL